MITRSKVSLVLLASIIGVSAWALMPPDEECVYDGKGFVQINIFYNSTTTFAPAIKIASRGDFLKFKLLGPPHKTVEVKNKVDTDAWLNGKGKNNHFYVCVPLDVEIPVDYGYSVKPDGSPLLDPIVRILN